MKIRYIISSHVRYEAVTVPPLLRSLRDIDPADVFVAVGGADVLGERVQDGVTYLYADHNSFDWTGPIEVVARGIPADWWFWLHDTCECGPHFRELAEGNFDPDADMTAVYVEDGFAVCNFGIYRHELFMRCKDYLLGLKGLSKAQGFEHEGGLFRWNMGAKAIYPNANRFYNGLVNRYDSPGFRIMEHYQAVDLYKYKANCGQNQHPYRLSP